MDIRKFFDTLSHQHLGRFLRQRVRDGVILRLIGKWLRAGVMEAGTWQATEEGTPQGGIISPLLANIYLHEVLDKWFAEQIKPKLKGRSFLIRYADDFVLGFTCEESGYVRLSGIHALLGPSAVWLPDPQTQDGKGPTAITG